MNGVEILMNDVLLDKVLIPLIAVTAVVVVITVLTAILSYRHLRKGRASDDKPASRCNGEKSSDDGSD